MPSPKKKSALRVEVRTYPSSPHDNNNLPYSAQQGRPIYLHPKLTKEVSKCAFGGCEMVVPKGSHEIGFLAQICDLGGFQLHHDFLVM